MFDFYAIQFATAVVAASLADNLFALVSTILVSATAIVVAVVAQGRSTRNSSSDEHAELLAEVRELRAEFTVHLDMYHHHDHGRAA